MDVDSEVALEAHKKQRSNADR